MIICSLIFKLFAAVFKLGERRDHVFLYLCLVLSRLSWSASLGDTVVVLLDSRSNKFWYSTSNSTFLCSLLYLGSK